MHNLPLKKLNFFKEPKFQNDINTDEKINNSASNAVNPRKEPKQQPQPALAEQG